jgi:transcriptional regulator with XRE-family HTH domain
MKESAPAVGDIQQDEFPARLRQAIGKYGSVSALARAISRSDGAVRKWLRGVSEPNVSDLRAISIATGVSIDWLVTGRSESHLTESGVQEVLSSFPSASAAMNYTLLEDIMDSVDGELRSSGVHIGPTKRSTIVVTLYRLFRETEAIDREAVARLVKLAA